jgi:hypothetical protein
MLDEPKRIAIGIVHVQLARAPTLINRAFMDVLGSVRIPGRAQSSLPKLAEECVNVIRRNDNRLTKFPVATVAGEEESIPVARQHAERRVREIVIGVDALEIEHAGVERQRRLHVSTADSWEDCHTPSNTKAQLPAGTTKRVYAKFNRDENEMPNSPNGRRINCSDLSDASEIFSSVSFDEIPRRIGADPPRKSLGWVTIGNCGDHGRNVYIRHNIKVVISFAAKSLNENWDANATRIKHANQCLVQFG